MTIERDEDEDVKEVYALILKNPSRKNYPFTI